MHAVERSIAGRSFFSRRQAGTRPTARAFTASKVLQLLSPKACGVHRKQWRRLQFIFARGSFRAFSLVFFNLSRRCRKGSVSRLALGLKKGEASGRDGWRREFDAAEACFSCRKRFKAVTRQRHHCGRYTSIQKYIGDGRRCQ